MFVCHSNLLEAVSLISTSGSGASAGTRPDILSEISVFRSPITLHEVISNKLDTTSKTIDAFLY